jgi:hypothetical protein
VRSLSARISAATLCTAATLVLGACGSLLDDPAAQSAPFPGLTGPEIINRAVATTRAASPVRLTVTTESADGPEQVFVAAGARGECTGTFSMGAAGTMELVRTQGTVYTKSDEAMLREAAADGTDGADAGKAIKRLTGRWIKARPGDRRTEESLRYCDPLNILDRLAKASDTATTGKRATVAGTPSLTLTGRAGGEKWTASVATEGKPYVLKTRITDSSGKPVTVEFSEFGKPITVKRPTTK